MSVVRRMRRSGPIRGRCDSGFTLIEMITVLVLVAILAFVALPRLTSATFDARGFHDASKAAVQYGRRVAVASRRYVCVNVASGTGAVGVLSLRMDTTIPESVSAVSCMTSATGTAIPLPTKSPGCANTNEVCAPSGVTLGGSSLIFDPLGRSVTSARAVQNALSVTISNDSPIVVQGETGYIL